MSYVAKSYDGLSGAQFNPEPESGEAVEVVTNFQKPDDTGGLAGADWFVLCALKVLKDHNAMNNAARENYIMSAFMQLRGDKSKVSYDQTQDIALGRAPAFVSNVLNRARAVLGIASGTLPTVTPAGGGALTFRRAVVSPGGGAGSGSGSGSGSGDGALKDESAGMSTNTMLAVGLAAVIALRLAKVI
jgi:hypothetical protein